MGSIAPPLGQWPALREKDFLAPFQVNPKGRVPKEVHEPSPFNRKETKERIPHPFSAPTMEEKSPTVKPRAFPVMGVSGALRRRACAGCGGRALNMLPEHVGSGGWRLGARVGC
ncbi:hypothetical protein ES332_A03G145000v1 [Gossypium tomentosum]|uniref:Uncharacterized protein n=1 Tax=Gossypium tomentosum TaxID=34277 RepID=A0A5D2R7D0_GOSTO|nr:hypothetical protein ES332_A03G145000v1 [Gossypium tomentosum]